MTSCKGLEIQAKEGVVWSEQREGCVCAPWGSLGGEGHFFLPSSAWCLHSTTLVC